MSDERPSASEKDGVRAVLTDALRYWEWRRLGYNLVLAATVAVEHLRQLPGSREALKPEGFLTLFIFAVLANVAYCAAYVPDLLVQFSEFRNSWRIYRGAVWLLGTLFAIVLTHFFATGIFAIP